MADFVANFNLELMPLVAKEAVLMLKRTSGVWTMFMDGASNVKVVQSRDSSSHTLSGNPEACY